MSQVRGICLSTEQMSTKSSILIQCCKEFLVKAPELDVVGLFHCVFIVCLEAGQPNPLSLIASGIKMKNGSVAPGRQRKWQNCCHAAASGGAKLGPFVYCLFISQLLGFDRQSKTGTAGNREAADARDPSQECQGAECPQLYRPRTL